MHFSRDLKEVRERDVSVWGQSQMNAPGGNNSKHRRSGSVLGVFCDSEEPIVREGMSKGDKSEEGDLGLWRTKHHGWPHMT